MSKTGELPLRFSSIFPKERENPLNQQPLNGKPFGFLQPAEMEAGPGLDIDGLFKAIGGGNAVPEAAGASRELRPCRSWQVVYLFAFLLVQFLNRSVRDSSGNSHIFCLG